MLHVAGIIIGMVIIKGEAPEQSFLRDSLDYSFTANATLGRRESLCADYSRNYFFMGGTLEPPYHLPVPPCKLASVIITVLDCKNLKSRLKRIIPRKLNPQVILEFNGRQQKTQVVKNCSNPVFCPGGDTCEKHQNPFVFEIPETMDERHPESCIKFLIEDIHGFGLVNDRLAGVKVPLAALKCVVSTENPIKMKIPLDIRRRHFGIRETVGILPKNDDIRVSRPDDVEIPRENAENSASMTILISKIDDLKLWLLREFAIRDEMWEADVLAERDRKDDEGSNSNGVPERGLKKEFSFKRNPALDESNYSQLFPYFLWSLPRHKYDTV